eukprot:362083-Chlamydomonas_euryale.AAC.3
MTPEVGTTRRRHAPLVPPKTLATAAPLVPPKTLATAAPAAAAACGLAAVAMEHKRDRREGSVHRHEVAVPAAAAMPAVMAPATCCMQAAAAAAAATTAAMEPATRRTQAAAAAASHAAAATAAAATAAGAPVGGTMRRRAEPRVRNVAPRHTAASSAAPTTALPTADAVSGGERLTAQCVRQGMACQMPRHPARPRTIAAAVGAVAGWTVRPTTRSGGRGGSSAHKRQAWAAIKRLALDASFRHGVGTGCSLWTVVLGPCSLPALHSLAGYCACYPLKFLLTFLLVSLLKSEREACKSEDSPGRLLAPGASEGEFACLGGCRTQPVSYSMSAMLQHVAINVDGSCVLVLQMAFLQFHCDLHALWRVGKAAR